MKLKFRSAAMLLAAVLVAGTAPAFAHNGVDHVGGTVAKVSGKVLTVKTPAGMVDVKLDDKTAITKNSVKAMVSDLTPGTKIVVDVPEESKEKVARAVRIGAAAAPDHGHDAHK